MRLLVLLLIFLGVNAKACDELIGAWTCKFGNGDTMEVSISKNSNLELIQSKIGIQMGPFILDDTNRSLIDSARVEMKYTGACQANKLELYVEQIYMGGLSVKFEEHFEYVDKNELSFTLVDIKPGKQPVAKKALCQN